MGELDRVDLDAATNGERRPEQTVVISGNRIQSVGPATRVPVPKAAEVVDAHGKYLIPGLWDRPFHLTGHPEVAYRLFVANGITGIRNMGSSIPVNTIAATAARNCRRDSLGAALSVRFELMEQARWLSSHGPDHRVSPPEQRDWELGRNGDLANLLRGRCMSSRSWLVLGMLAFPALALAQTVKEADVFGAWEAELEHADSRGKELGTRGWLVLWPDGLWWYGGALMHHEHGGARWRLVGDTLWLGNDYTPYFHPMIDRRILAIQAKGYGLAAMDMEVINTRPPYPVPDSIYWSRAFRDTVTTCDGTGRPQCGTWVYKVAKRGPQLDLVRLDHLSRNTHSVATKAVLTRDSLLHCSWISGCD